MSRFPVSLHKHLDVLQFHEAGGLLLGASSLAGQFWRGSLWYFSDPDTAPDRETCTAGVELESGITDAQWINDTRFITALDSGAVSLMEMVDDFTTFNTLSVPVEHDNIVNSVSVTCDKATAVSASHDRKIKLWDLEEGLATHTYKAHGDIVWSVACHPTEPKSLLSASQDGRVLLWDLRQPKPASIVNSNTLQGQPTCVAWQVNNPHGIVIGGDMGHMVYMDSRKGQEQTMCTKPHNRNVHRIVASKERSDWLASISEDCSVAVTELSQGKANVIYKDTSHKDFVQGASWCPKNNRLYTCSWDSKVNGHNVRHMDMEISSPVSMVTESAKKVILENGIIDEQVDSCYNRQMLYC